MVVNNVRFIVGAERAYACITYQGGSLDVALSGGSPEKNLRAIAKDWRDRAEELIKKAAVAEAAADMVRR